MATHERLTAVVAGTGASDQKATLCFSPALSEVRNAAWRDDGKDGTATSEGNAPSIMEVTFTASAAPDEMAHFDAT